MAADTVSSGVLGINNTAVLHAESDEAMARRLQAEEDAIDAVELNSAGSVPPAADEVSASDTTHSAPWLCYLIVSHTGKHTYVGATCNFPRRLRQHNGELVGGARQTAAHRPWRAVYTTMGFRNQRECLQFEWSLKRLKGGRGGHAPGVGLKGRFKNMHRVLAKPRWTSQAPSAAEVPLTLEWYASELRPADFASGLPSHVTEVVEPQLQAESD